MSHFWTNFDNICWNLDFSISNIGSGERGGGIPQSPPGSIPDIKLGKGSKKKLNFFYFRTPSPPIGKFQLFLNPYLITYWIWYIYHLGPLHPNIDDSLNKYNDKINIQFSRHWTKHKCTIPECGTVLIFDGGCKVLSQLKLIFKRRQVASILRSVGLSVCLQNEIYVDETHCSKHLNEKCLL